MPWNRVVLVTTVILTATTILVAGVPQCKQGWKEMLAGSIDDVYKLDSQVATVDCVNGECGLAIYPMQKEKLFLASFYCNKTMETLLHSSKWEIDEEGEVARFVCDPSLTNDSRPCNDPSVIFNVKGKDMQKNQQELSKIGIVINTKKEDDDASTPESSSDVAPEDISLRVSHQCKHGWMDNNPDGITDGIYFPLHSLDCRECGMSLYRMKGNKIGVALFCRNHEEKIPLPPRWEIDLKWERVHFYCDPGYITLPTERPWCNDPYIIFNVEGEEKKKNEQALNAIGIIINTRTRDNTTYIFTSDEHWLPPTATTVAATTPADPNSAAPVPEQIMDEPASYDPNAAAATGIYLAGVSLIAIFRFF